MILLLSIAILRTHVSAVESLQLSVGKLQRPAAPAHHPTFPTHDAAGLNAVSRSGEGVITMTFISLG